MRAALRLTPRGTCANCLILFYSRYPLAGYLDSAVRRRTRGAMAQRLASACATTSRAGPNNF